MASEWKVGRLGDYVDSSLGKMLDKNKNKGEPHPYLGNKSVRWGSFDLENLARMPFENKEQERYGLKFGDLIVCEGGEPGRCAIWKDQIPNMKIQKALHRIRPKSEIDNFYLYYWFLWAGKNDRLEQYFTGTTIQHLTGKALASIELRIPPLPLQKDIVSVLSCLDNKIELNRQTNQTLEKMAQALFKSWFVDFDPVIDNALEAGNTIPDELQERAECRQQQLAKPDHQPLPEDIRQFFPSEFALTEELGWVPMGWGVKRAEMLSEKIAMGPFGSNLKVSTFVESGVPIISGHHLKGFLLDEHKHKFITNEHAEKLKNSTVFPGDIIFTHAGNIGQVAMIPKNVSFEKFVISQRQFYLRPNLAEVSAAYLLYYFKSHLGQHKLLANASQVGVPSIARPSSHLKGIELVVPGLELMSVFDEQCNSIIGKIMGIRQNVESLTKFRDTLLPKLISGELRLPSDTLPDAEQQLSDATS